MTQALNLALFANNLNTAGATNNTGLQNSAVTVTAGTGLSGGGSVALGSSVTLNNAGVTSISAGTGISVSANTGGVTISASGGGVTSLNGQTGAITNTGLDSIGSYVFACQVTTSGYLAGSTIAGSNLYRANTIVSYNGVNIVSNGNNSGIPPYTVWYADYVSRATGGNVGLGVPQGASNLSGTWRSMGSISKASSSYSGEDNRTDTAYGAGLWVRVS
jgi:hypothetical protein